MQSDETFETSDLPSLECDPSCGWPVAVRLWVIIVDCDCCWLFVSACDSGWLLMINSSHHIHRQPPNQIVCFPNWLLLHSIKYYKTKITYCHYSNIQNHYSEWVVINSLWTIHSYQKQRVLMFKSSWMNEWINTTNLLYKILYIYIYMNFLPLYLSSSIIINCLLLLMLIFLVVTTSIFNLCC